MILISRPFPPAAALLVLPLLLALALPPPARAVTTKDTSLQRIQRSVARIDREAATPEGEAAVVKRLAAQLGLTEDALRERHDTWALGYGEIAMVYGFARASRRQSTSLPDQIVQMRRDGQDWRAIAKQLGVSIDAVAARVRRSEPRRR